MTGFLQKQYPVPENFLALARSYFFVGAFVALFLLVFQPFGINLWQTGHKILKITGYGFISFVVPSVISLVFATTIAPVYRRKKWTVAHETVFVLTILMCIALGNLVYSRYLGIAHFTLKNYIAALLVTVSVGIFPVTGILYLRHQRMLRKNHRDAATLNDAIQTMRTETENPAADREITLASEKGKIELRLHAKNLIYIESADNYSCVIYVHEGARKRTMIRGSLARMEEQVRYAGIVRCHRSYIVNLSNVIRVEGNAAGYQLFFDDSAASIPVSRSYLKAVKELLSALQVSAAPR